MSQIGVTRLKRKPSLVRGREESASARAERKRFIRSMMEERTSKFEDTTLTEPVIDKDNKPVTYKDERGRTVPVQQPISQAYELGRAIEVATHGWNLGKKYPVDKSNILAYKRLVNLANMFERDLGPNNPATKWILGKLQNHNLTLWPRSNTYDAKEIDMVEAPPNMDEMLRLFSQRFGLGVPVATDLSRQQQQQEETE